MNVLLHFNRFRFLLVLLCLPMMAATAQKQDQQHARIKQKINTHKIAFITERLQLTESEAEKFWPVYREYEEERKSLKSDISFKGGKEEMTEEDAEKLLDNMVALKSKEVDLQKKYNKKFKSVLSAKKVVKLYKAEKEFKSKMVDYIREKPRRRHR